MISFLCIITYDKTINLNLNLNDDSDHSHLPKLLFLLFPFTKWHFFCKLVCFPLFSISISNGPSLALVDIIQKKLVTVLSAQDMSGKY